MARMGLAEFERPVASTCLKAHLQGAAQAPLLTAASGSAQRGQPSGGTPDLMPPYLSPLQETSLARASSSPPKGS